MAEGPAEWPPQAIRLFVSSTFVDLDAEREVLAKDVFPRIRELCQERGATFAGIDLRSGIPPQRVAAGELLRTCLHEIDRCRPFFLAILADRYGTIVEVPARTLDEHPWLAGFRHASITEIEIRHGALNDPAAAHRALFFLRQAQDEATPAAGGEGNADAGGPEPGVERLRDEIAAARFRTHPFRDLGEFRDVVYDRLKALVDELLPESAAGHREDEARAHEAMARERSRFHEGRGAEILRLEADLASGAGRVAITGAPGTGKSALLAAWLRRHRRRHPDACVVAHFVGVSDYGANVAAMLRRILTELIFRSGASGPIPEVPAAVDLAAWLRLAAARCPVTVLVDGLDGLDVPENRSLLHWLPDGVPEGVRFVVSVASGPHTDELARRGWRTHELLPLRPRAVAKAVRRLLRFHAKELDAATVARIVATPAAATPRFLAMLLEEVRLAGRGSALDETLERCLAAADATELFRVLLRRCERDFDPPRPGLVRTAMGALWASWQGLSETELMRLLGNGAEPIPQVDWSRFFLAVEHALSYRQGRLVLASQEHREAVRREYAGSGREEFDHRHRLVWFLKNHADVAANVRELPRQLERLRDWGNLLSVLGRAEAFERLWNWDPWEVRRLWASIERETGRSAEAVYAPAVADPAAFGTPRCIWHLATLLTDLGHTDAALRLRLWLLDHYQRASDPANTAASLGHVAALERRLGHLPEALRTLARQLDSSREIHNLDLVLEALVNKAGIEADCGDLDDSLRTYAELEEELRKHPKPGVLQVFHNGIGIVQQGKGDLDAALRSFETAAAIAREAGDLGAQQAAVGNVATVWLDRGELELALRLLKEQEQVCRRIGHRQGLVGALGNRGVALLRQGRIQESLAAHAEELRVAREIGFAYGQKQGLGHLAAARLAAGSLVEAADCYVELAELCGRHGETDNRRIGFHNAAAALLSRGRELGAAGDPAGAVAAFRRMLEYAVEASEPDTLDVARYELVSELHEAAMVDFAAHRYEEALAQLREQAELSLARDDEDTRQAALRNQAVILRVWGEEAYDGAGLGTKLRLARDFERVWRELGDEQGADVWLGMIGAVLQNLFAEQYEAGSLESALATVREAAEVYRRLGDADRLGRMLEYELTVLSELRRGAGGQEEENASP